MCPAGALATDVRAQRKEGPDHSKSLRGREHHMKILKWLKWKRAK